MSRNKGRDADAVLAEDVRDRALAPGRDFKTTMGNILKLTPPLTVTADEMDRAINKVDDCLDAAGG